MAKKKTSTAPTLPKTARDDLQAARDQMAMGDVDTALELLDALNERHPRQREILSTLMEACLAAGESLWALEVAEEWQAFEPRAAGASYARVRAYALQNYIALTASAADLFLDQFPQDPRAEAVRTLGALARSDLEHILPQFAPEPADARMLAKLHEQGRRALDLGRYDEARGVIERILVRFPEFTPALNNRSLLEMVAGDLSAAIQTLRSVAAREPDNVHTLANLTRYLVMTGQDAAAEEVAQRLRGAPPEPSDFTVKRLEAFGFLGDDLEVLRLVRGLGQAADAFALHLGGVAAWRLVHLEEARRFWERALEIDPDDAFVAEALDDLDAPASEQEGPQAFDLADWVPEAVVRTLTAAIERVQTRGVAAAVAATRQVLERYPFLVAVAPTLLVRGGPAGRDFVLNLAGVAETPELLGAVKAHALSQVGSDDLRLRAAQLVVDKGLLPAGPTRLWIEGAWQDIVLISIEIQDEPLRLFRHGKAVTKWLKASLQASHRGDRGEAERLLRLGLREEPDAPDLLNNLAAVLVATERQAEAEPLLRDLVARHGDYSFARTNLASLLAIRGEIQAAHDLVDPLVTRRSMHRLELAALCAAQVQIAESAGEEDLAEQWLELWNEVRPDDPRLAEFRD